MSSQREVHVNLVATVSMEEMTFLACACIRRRDFEKTIGASELLQRKALKVMAQNTDSRCLFPVWHIKLSGVMKSVVLLLP